MSTAEVTADDLADLREMTTAHVRRNYHLCGAQLDMVREDRDSCRLDDAAHTLNVWQATYLDELVRRGERV